MDIETLIASFVRIIGQGAIIVYAYSWVIRTVEHRLLRGVIVGLLFGLGGILSMNDPAHLMPGIIYDGRSILLILAPIYSGPIGTVIAALLMGVYRLTIGGVGAVGGSAGVAAVAITGYLLTLLPRPLIGSGGRRSVLFGLATISSFVVLAFLPTPVAHDLFLSAAAPVMIANVAGVFLLSDLLAREKYRVHIQRALENEASVDPLTRLPNRRVLQRAGDNCTKEAETKRIPYSIIMLDIDHFKRINDTWGHTLGDTVLAKVADVIRQKVRKTDVAARYGGEEIVILLPNTSEQDATAVAEKIRMEIEDSALSVDHESIKVTVSMGIACAVTPTIEFKAVLEAADKALYRAKIAGRNRVEISFAA